MVCLSICLCQHWPTLARTAPSLDPVRGKPRPKAGEDVKFSPASPRLAAHSGQMTPYRAFGEPLFSLGCSILKIPMSIRRAQ